MSSTDVTPATKPYAQSQTIQGAVLQLVVSLTAVLALFFPRNADQINNIGQAIQNYGPVIGGIVVSVLPFIHTVVGRTKATTALV